MAKQRILLVDDHEVVRLGLKSLLERHPQFDVVGEASTAREALEQVTALKPDVVVMDIRLPGTSGIEACEDIVNRYPNTKVIMLTSYAEDEMLFSAIRAGASARRPTTRGRHRARPGRREVRDVGEQRQPDRADGEVRRRFGADQSEPQRGASQAGLLTARRDRLGVGRPGFDDLARDRDGAG